MGRVPRGHGEGQADGVPGRWIRVLPDDQYFDVRQRLPERAEDVRRRRQHLVPGRDVVGQETQDGTQVLFHPRQGGSPVAGHQVAERQHGHLGKPDSLRRFRLQLEEGL